MIQLSNLCLATKKAVCDLKTVGHQPQRFLFGGFMIKVEIFQVLEVILMQVFLRLQFVKH